MERGKGLGGFDTPAGFIYLNFAQPSNGIRVGGKLEMRIERTRSAVFGLTLCVTSCWAAITLCQPQPQSRAAAAITDEDKAAAERAALSDARIRAILGAGQPRVVTAEAEADKGEAENFLAGKSATPPGRRVVVMVSNTQVNKAARALVSLPQYQVLAVESIRPADIPLVRDDADQALALAKANPELRQAVGDTLDRYAILEPGNEERVPFAAQILPVASTNRNDPCSTDRCLDLIFRTENGYLPLRAHVDLTRRTVAILGGGRRR
jgi:hypothetical protein